MSETEQPPAPEDQNAAAAAAEAVTEPKKESFQWSTPADEFADDVGSDIEEEGPEDRGAGEEGGELTLKRSKKDSPGGKSVARAKARSKQSFPCPKCDKVWNWPWELRRHLLMHFKEVSVF